MQPLQLTLKGFRGIRDGLGRDEITLDLEQLADGARLIAIAGSNGSGKSTIIDNLTPYMGLPSRSPAAGAGGFCYYDHVYLLESIKDLTWAHEGRRYRSQLVIRVGSRRKTEAYLHVFDDGRWQPVRLDDGTVSDGRVETYTRCVESLCGSAETFFTSVFAAQGKRQLNTYRNAEIKTLLGDLLGHENIRALGVKAAETIRLLKVAMSTMRQQQAGLADERSRAEAALARLKGADNRLASAEHAKEAAHAMLDAVQVRYAWLEAEREQSKGIELRRSQLMAERQAVVDAHAQAVRVLESREQAECQRLKRLDQRIAERLQRERSRRQALTQSRQRCWDVLAEAETVRWAASRLPLAERLQRLRAVRTQAGRERARALTQSEGEVRLVEQQIAAIEREAGKAVLKAEELTRRFALTGEVPCAGTALQSRCKLLTDAREAHALIPNANAHVARLAAERAAAQRELIAVRQRRDSLASAPQALARTEHREAIARERLNRLAILASRTEACVQARTTLVEIERELTALGSESAPGVAHTLEERAERQAIADTRCAIAQQMQREQQQSDASLGRLDCAMAALPPAYDERQLAGAGQAIEAAREAFAAAERAQLAAARDAQSFEETSAQSAALAERLAQLNARIARIEDELGHWNLLARCLSNDGVIALAIDDAGPTLSALANDLLLSCYGARFTVSIRTLLETGKGEQKEGFDIVVHDAETGDSKSLSLMSGGERTWVEACLTRAIALYLARCTGRRYTTLFSDEADGALDPERKRMFMAMKREVLRLGGYEHEFFVSQTPALTAMADAVIDLDALKARAGSSQRALAVG